MHSSTLLQRLQSRQAVVGVVGLGYVGLPLALTFCRAGFRVVGFDTDPSKVHALCSGRSYIRHIAASDVQKARQSHLVATGDFAAVAGCDALLLCVPTPLGKNREPDMTFIDGTAASIAPQLARDTLVVLESTTYPGTTDERLRTRLEAASGLRAGQDFYLAFSPEREDPGNPGFQTASIPKVIGGLTPTCLEAALALYSSVIEKVVPVSSTRVAEMTKLLENVFRSVNIALVNELKILADAMGIDIWEVIDAAATKPFGFMPFYPGPGLGGHCIPIDPFYLTWKAREYDQVTRFIELAGEINTAMPTYVLGRLTAALNDRSKALRGSRILIVGVAYKRNVDDLRESPALRLMNLLLARGAEVAYHDPCVPRLPPTRQHTFERDSVAVTPQSLQTFDAAVIVTDHSSVDYDAIVQHCPLVVDTRNATRRVREGRERIVRA